MTVVNKVLVVGGGIGGLSTAIALKRANIDVEVVELHGKRDVYHVGIIVQANFIRAMDALGIAEKALAIGYPYHTLTFTDLHGNKLHEVEVQQFADGKFPPRLGMTRPALHEVLLESIAELDIPMRNHLTFESLHEDVDGVSVTFTDGSSSRYDFIVGADGLYSKVRDLLFKDNYRPKYTGQGVWRYNIPRPAELKTSFTAMGPEIKFGKCGFVPLSETTGYIWLTSTDPKGTWIDVDKLADELKSRLSGCTGVIAELAEHIIDSKLVVYRPLEAVFINEPWHKGRIMVIGDAAHGATPHLGQGAAQAIEDAVVLGEEFAKDQSLKTALENFHQRRHERCKFIAEGSVQIGQWEQEGDKNNHLAVELTQKMIIEVAKPL